MRYPAIDHFVEEVNASLKRFKADPRHWKTIPFLRGREHLFEYAGDSTTAHIQLCAPLYLTDEDRRLSRASVYAACELSRDPKTKELRCWIPSILDAPTATADANNLRRALAHDYTPEYKPAA